MYIEKSFIRLLPGTRCIIKNIVAIKRIKELNKSFCTTSSISSMSESKPAKRSRMEGESTYPSFGTLAIHAGQEPEQWKSLSVVPQISLSTTFKQYVPGEPVSPNHKYFLLIST